ncbi:helix-turn-helix transcriptional regulator [Chitinophaga pendula]|uniref:helix-turn-helix transcriptional regulator n=1 Tax=Chitinophaga TaxID=79328 RepID=UPI000BAF109A|nr:MULTISPECIES: helix-turn-helix transcriptional regulator [Chitinophaga]ASZ14589.1 hypothetical protein CK934_28365 [Chitinophaga sp. MD30]UCJ07759.1 helix-turn-helix transcriptional regulator [Chitinophaga pendula]
MLRYPALTNGIPVPMEGFGPTPAIYKQSTTSHRKTVYLTEHMILFIQRGRKVLHFGERTVEADSNTFMIMKSGVYVMSDVVPEEGMYEAVLLHCTDEQLRNFLVQYDLMPAAPVAAGPDQLQLPMSSLLETFRKQYLEYLQRPAEQFPAIQALKLQELLLLLVSAPYKATILPFLQQIAHRVPADIDHVVHTHLFQPVTIGELARLSHRSLAAFKRDFQEKYQCSPRRWITQQRLQHAHMLLQNTQEQVANIALQCGFDNVPHFIRIFKQTYGFTPNSIRTKRAIF